VCLDETGAVVRPALQWNDTRSASRSAGAAAPADPTQGVQ
jgi:xylulokinase